MRYFLHDTSAFNDEKITELFIEYGYEGIGLFFTILEKLAQQEKPVKTSVLKSQLKVGKRLDKCWKFMETIGIISSNNGETFNKNILNSTEKFQKNREKNAKRISEWRENQADTENVTHSEQVCNTDVTPLSKDKLSKEKERKDKELLFDQFYNAYDKKVKKPHALKMWMKLDLEEMPAIILKAKQFVQGMKDRTYQPHPGTWINDRRWEDEQTKPKELPYQGLIL